MHIINYSMGVVCLVNLVMCASITCCLGGRSNCTMLFGMLSGSSESCMPNPCGVCCTVQLNLNLTFTRV